MAGIRRGFDSRSCRRDLERAVGGSFTCQAPAAPGGRCTAWSARRPLGYRLPVDGPELRVRERHHLMSGPAEPLSESPASGRDLERIIAEYNAAWNRQDLDAICALHAPGMVFENHNA